MPELIGRDYCLKNPGKIIKLFGLGVFLGMVFSKKKSLLERAIYSYRARGIPMPGHLGNAYKISATIEFRISRIYAGMAEKFCSHEAARDFFLELKEEEDEHGRLMLLCLYTVALNPNIRFTPSVLDPDIRNITKWLREIKGKINSLSLDEALKLTEELEKSEVNTIFEKLLKQTGQSQCLVFEERMRMVEGHSKSVPLKINKLRQALG